MTIENLLNPLNSTKLIGMDRHLNEMIELHKLKKFPKVLMLSGKKGIGKFTLVVHFLNYIFSQKEKNPYSLKEKTINKYSVFYNQLKNEISQDILLIKAEQNKNIKIEDIRRLKSTIANSSLSNNSRFIIIDEVEFINESSVNALLKSLEEPTVNNFFILINNKQAELIKTITSRCLVTNIFLNIDEKKNVINYLFDQNNVKKLIDYDSNITPGLFIRYNEIFQKLNMCEGDNFLIKIHKLLSSYKKNKDKILINLTLHLIDKYFFNLAANSENELDFLINLKLSIIKIVNNFIYYNLNINSVLNSIELKLKNA